MNLAQKLRRITPVLLAAAMAAVFSGTATAAPQSLRSGDFAVVGDAHLRISAYKKTLRSANAQGTKGKSARREVVTTHIWQAWYAGEAAALGISFTHKQVRKRFELLKQQSFPTDRDWKTFLKETGQTERDVLKLVRSSMLQEAVRQRWTTAVTVTEEEIAARFAENPARYEVPEVRDLGLVFNESKKKAKLARRALEGGQSLSAVARKYSQDQVSRNHGGRFPGVTKDQFPRVLERPIFAADVGDLVGPVKTQFGYYVVRILKITPAHPVPLSEVRGEIRDDLKIEKTEATWSAAEKDFKTRWRAVTVCRAFYATKDCGQAVP